LEIFAAVTVIPFGIVIVQPLAKRLCVPAKAVAAVTGVSPAQEPVGVVQKVESALMAALAQP
jgi:hypothetical protein